MKSRFWRFVLGAFLCGDLTWGADRVNLELVGECRIVGADYNPSALALEGRHAFVAVPGEFTVVDAMDPSQMAVLGNLPIDCDSVNGVVVSDGLAFVTGYSHRKGTGVLILVDISTPSIPRFAGCYQSGGQPLGLAVAGAYAFASWLEYDHVDGRTIQRSALYTIDISDPQHPTRVAVRLFDGTVGQVFVVGAHVCILEHSGFKILRAYDIANPMNLKLTDIYVNTCDVFNLVPLGRTFVAGTWVCWRAGVETLRLSEGGRFECLYDPTLGANICGIGRQDPVPFAADAGYACILLDGSVLVYDIEDPSSPRHLGNVEFPLSECCVFDIGVSGGKICALTSEGLSVHRIVELPAITRNVLQNGKLNLQWNEPARGMKLQRATSLTNPEWQDLIGSEATTGVELPLWGGQGFFRLVSP